MDPSDERRDRKRKKEYFDHLYNVADSAYGMPTRCPCGGRIIDEVRVKEEYDTRPGKRFFSCINYEVTHIIRIPFINLTCLIMLSKFYS